ncbi:hypothetical protein PLICRDRAFT_506534 [Plicaturopsis crispa FD-325 SS-3]|nr:hypothetical protein PLICRDRAFT_506534 [Plicaturopsis crispa FD-325 SS-3]
MRSHILYCLVVLFVFASHPHAALMAQDVAWLEMWDSQKEATKEIDDRMDWMPRDNETIAKSSSS